MTLKLFHVSAYTDCLVFAESAEDAIEMVRRDENRDGQSVKYTFAGICISEEFKIKPGIVLRGDGLNEVS
jgi:hypothetical protein